MRLWDKLAGRLEREGDSREVPSEVQELVSAALGIIKQQISFESGQILISSSGSEGKVAQAANLLEQAHRKCSADPNLHYAWASALHIAAQFKSAHEEMLRLAGTHPTFLPAQFAIKGWDLWESPFSLPEWGPGNTGNLPVVARGVQTAVLRPVRECITPRAAVFLRDRTGDFRDLNALNTARIDITTVVTDVRQPQLAAVYARIWDNPKDPYPVEILDFPLRQRGSPDRRKYEYLCLQDTIDFVIIDARDRLLLNKRFPIPSRMRAAHAELAKLLLDSEGTSIPTDANDSENWYRNVGLPAIRAYQSRSKVSDIRY